MLEYLHLKNVGPAPEMEMELAPRLNLITGDNGLGKTFLLDIAWWVLTRTWARVPVTPPARGWKRGRNRQRHLGNRLRVQEWIGQDLQEREYL